MTTDCTYCGCNVLAHDPVFVAEGEDRAEAGQYCNYGCLAAHIEEAELTTGTSCEWSPESASTD